MGLCSQYIYQEGLRIPPVYLVRKGAVQRDVLVMLLANVRTRPNARENWMAQAGSLPPGERRLREILEAYGVPNLLLP